MSDHTTNNYACFGAVALGASILERHFTDSMKREGEDICCSMDPHNLKCLIEGTKILFKERGGSKGPVQAEKPTIDFAFGSVVAIDNINKGDFLSINNIWIRRPGGGDFGPSDFDELIGKEVIKPIMNGQRISKFDLKNT